MTLASFETSVHNLFVTSETFVQNLIAKIHQDVAIVEKDLSTALSWVASNEPAIVGYIEAAIGFAASVGTGNPEVAVAVAGAQAAISALNAVAQAKSGGASDIQTLLAGYSAIKQAQAAAATAAAATTAVVQAKVAAPKA